MTAVRADNSILQRIGRRKREEVAERMARRPMSALREASAAAGPVRDFAAALHDPSRAVPSPVIRAICEIKRRSPSKGALRPDLDPADVARRYEAAGAAALSVLTDVDFFGGSDGDLQAARAAVGPPVLRKDFTVDAYQIHEARAIGADAVLLIVRMLSDAQLREFLALAGELRLAALVEVHDAPELERALVCGAAIIGVNNRNLDTFEVSLQTSLNLIGRIRAERDGERCEGEAPAEPSRRGGVSVTQRTPGGSPGGSPFQGGSPGGSPSHGGSPGGSPFQGGSPGGSPSHAGSPGGSPSRRIAVSESGIHTRADVQRLQAAGFDAILVGESLMTSADPGAKLRELLTAEKGPLPYGQGSDQKRPGRGQPGSDRPEGAR